MDVRLDVNNRGACTDLPQPPEIAQLQVGGNMNKNILRNGREVQHQGDRVGLPCKKSRRSYAKVYVGPGRSAMANTGKLARRCPLSVTCYVPDPGPHVASHALSYCKFTAMAIRNCFIIRLFKSATKQTEHVCTTIDRV